MASTARLDELKRKFDENPRRYFAPLANEHRKSGDVEQAIALCRTHLPQQPAHISGHIVLGQALFEAGQLDESRDTFQTALDLDPENLIALRYLGDIARAGSDVATARTWYHRVLEVDPRNEEIVQLVRDLDAPPESASVTDVEEHAAPSSAPVIATEAPPAAAPPVASKFDESRFAPLTIDQFDADAELFAPTGDSTSSAASEAPSNDAHAAQSAEAPTAEMPVLELPELDPFDMPASANADSLFDASADAGADNAGFVLDELATPTEPADLDDFDVAPSEAAASWNAQQDQYQPDAPAAMPAAETTAPGFEEGSFYLEPPPASAHDWSDPAAAPDVADQAIEATTADPASVAFPEAVTPTSESEGWQGIAPAPPAVDAPNASTVDAEFEYAGHAEPSMVAVPPTSSEVPSAEAAPLDPGAASPVDRTPVDDGLGLEVMEFVPPTASATPSMAPGQPEADPLVGHMPELTSPGTGARPDAFVTETMAELYLQQGFRNEALAVYHELLARNPGDTSLRDRIDQIESGSMSSLGMATLSENVVESARKRQTERPTRSVRSFFASLAGRRAPQSHSREVEAAADEMTESDPRAIPDAAESPTGSSYQSQSEYSAGTESSYGPVEPPADAADGPNTAAEQMAAFDPFADAWDGPGTQGAVTPNDGGSSAETLAPSDAPAESSFASPSPDAIPFASAAPEPTPVPEPRSAPRSLQELFPESSATPRADAAAQTLATAFGRPEPQGRPTRAASNELSLDRVFRGAPEDAPAPDGGFSFDQFFSDARSGGGEGASTPVPSSPSDSGRTSESSDAHDIEQFTAWLEGLKKK